MQRVAPVYAFISAATEEQFAAYHKYFGTLALMAKNDLFFQFEHHIVHDFTQCFEMATKAYGDWDGRPETLEHAIVAMFPGKQGINDFIEFVRSGEQISQWVRDHNLQRAITLEDAAKAKMVFDTYIQFKTRNHLVAEIERGSPMQDELDD